MYRYNVPQLPDETYNHPLVKAGAVDNSHGTFFDIRFMPFNNMLYGNPVHVHWVRDEETHAVANVQTLRPEQLLKIYQTSCNDVDAFFNAAIDEKNKGDRLRWKVVGASSLVALFGINSACSAVEYNRTTDCGETSYMQQECLNGHAQTTRTEAMSEVIGFGVGAALLACVTIGLERSRRKHNAKANTEFTKVALAIGNLRTCEASLNEGPADKTDAPHVTPSLG